jgi:uncharacterized protein (TIGR02118 family)
MVKVVILFRRAPGITHEACVQHWNAVHAPLVCASGIGRRYLRRYVNCEIRDCLPLGAPEYDGLAELWFDSRADFAAFFADPEYAASVGADAAKFADMANLQVFVTEETRIL